MADQIFSFLQNQNIKVHMEVARFLLSILVVALAFTFRSVFLHRIVRRNRSRSIIGLKKTSTYITIGVVLSFLFLIWLPALGNILTLFSIIGTGIIIVLKEVVLNFAGWVYILIRRPFEPGNRIRIGAFAGDVIDVRLLDFSMIEVMPREEGGQSTGRILRVPNSMLFVQPLANASMEFSYYWNEIAVKLTPRSDWNRALKIMEKVGEEYADRIRENDPGLTSAASNYAIYYRSIKPKVYVEYKHGGIYLYLRHLTEPRKAREDTDRLWRELLTRFKKEKNLELAEE